MCYSYLSGYVHGIGVLKQHRGQGYGRLLLQWAMAYNRERGFKTIELNVDSGNESGALRLYESAGMQPFLRWERWQRPDWANLASKGTTK